MTWSRETPWRQGSVISTPDASSLGLLSTPDQVAVVVSHDCDLVQDPTEDPDVEVIVAHRVLKVMGNFAFAKHPRRLHVEFRDSGAAACVELSAAAKKPIPKPSLAPYRPDTALILPQDGRSILQRWLAIRYRRQAVPEALATRIKPIDIPKILRKANAEIAVRAVYVAWDPQDDQLPADQIYQMKIYLVYSADDPAQGKAAEAAAEAIIDAFADAFRIGERWTSVDLVECEAVADTDFSHRDIWHHVDYKFEHLSLRHGDAAASNPD